MAIRGEVIGLGLWLLGAGTIFGWLAVNFFGLFENARMRTQLQRILIAKNETLTEPIFVGFATPRYSSALDPHEDVGFLAITPDRLRFVSETRTVEVPKAAVTQVRLRGNVHTLLGLGRWVSVEGTIDGKPIRFLMEPREYRTLLANKGYAKRLAQRLNEWRVQTA